MPHATTMCDTISKFISLHESQLEKSGIPKRFWNKLFEKMKNEVFDAGEVFTMLKVVDSGAWSDDEEDIAAPSHQMAEDSYCWQVEVSASGGIDPQDSQHVYLVDHAWTYRVDQARNQLESVPGLLTRMTALMDVDMDGRPKDEVVEDVLANMWKYNQTYSIGNAELNILPDISSYEKVTSINKILIDQNACGIEKFREILLQQWGTDDAVPIWYIMDEFGSRIQHSDMPTVKMVPFYYVASRLAFTVLWPLKRLEKGDELTRDYIEPGVTDLLVRKAKLLPWQPDDLTHLSYEQQEQDESFYRKYEVHETLPDLMQDFPGLPRDRNVRVFTDVHLVETHLTDPRFEFVSDPEDADIWWTRKYLRDFRAFSHDSPGRFISQFPFEMVLTVKDLLAMIARRGGHVTMNSLRAMPKWHQTTYNLKTELPKFASYFQHREIRGLDNHWICKPYNLSRSLDMHITNNLDYIMRLPESGPKIACKYIEDPVLLAQPGVGLVKFDLRFVLLLYSVQPLRAAVYDNFIVRLANKEFSLDHFDDFEKHFTVMNYKEDVEMNEVNNGQFMELWESQYPEIPWTQLQGSVYDVLREVLEAASSEPPPKGIAESPQSRAMYGVDIMFKWDIDEKGERYMQPVLFEVNFVPDTTRLCKTYPDFVNDCFSALFLEDYEAETVTIL